MMDDIFMERIVHRKKDASYYIKMVSLILTAVLVMITLVWLLLAIPTISFLVPITLAATLYGVWWAITSMDVEFEYIVTNGEIDIDTIVHRRKRKRLFSGRSKDFEIMGRLDSDEFREAAARLPQERKAGRIKVVDCSAVPGADSSWFFIANYKSARLMVVFDPDSRMLASLKRYNPSRIKYNPALHG
ncbi:MAG: hypothetical protein GX153_06590 [Clostridiaceae bacterium]|nr:hypothetical protein [Clostridiaceae bacterium]